jgi:hypothetical protein
MYKVLGCSLVKSDSSSSSFFSRSNVIQLYSSSNVFESESHFPAKSISCSYNIFLSIFGEKSVKSSAILFIAFSGKFFINLKLVGSM